ncbi:MFS transporter [Candidatus Acidianus copahuensis]|uniref:MFS transporter n=1 Tax=Candidatus Acidianus copahuensis TaxID=1160895 RepID=A0A031LKE9_9CREN|nr:MFS transporter [Candidatus Acidianus copahuensis]EZQ02031.1 MFS transporter [Candidatus Acidianus copahuensis]
MQKKPEGKAAFEELDNMKLSFKHIKIWYTAGMGFFTDAYDLFIIGAILDIFTVYKLPGFQLNPFYEGLLASSAIVTAIIGQLLFGFLADRIGRKKVYGVEASLLTAGAFLSGLSPNLAWLIAFRMIMGFGIGGDYPISATIMSEYSNVKDRGKLVALVFANQGIGTLVAVAVGAISAFTLPADIAWRVMAIVGGIPAATVIYLRRKVPETPRYAAMEQKKEDLGKSTKFMGVREENQVVIKRISFGQFISKYWKVLLGTAGTWFILDVAFYGTGVYSGPIVSSILGKPVNVGTEIVYAGIPFMVGFFGYFTAVGLMDKLGRKLIQIQGFLVMAIIYAIVSAVMISSGVKVIGFTIPVDLAFAIYALSYFFIDFGPNTTTFVIPAEIYPTSNRTTGHGISAAAGKTGAALTTYLFPLLLNEIGVKNILDILAVLSVIGVMLTYFTIKEPKLKNLEDVSEDRVEIQQEVK